MTGASSTPFIVSAYQKGIRGFGVERAYEGLRKNHLPGGLMSKAGYEHHTFKGGGIEQYIDKGYVPYPLSNTRYGFHQNGAAQTLEYAYQDFRSEEHTSELQSLMRISYAVFCLKKKKHTLTHNTPRP